MTGHWRGLPIYVLHLLLSCCSRNAAVRPLLGRTLSSIDTDTLSSPKKNSSYVLKLENNNNVEYYGDFTIGNQTLPSIYDTGSFEVLTLSTLCESCDRGGPVYDRKTSKTFEPGSG